MNTKVGAQSAQPSPLSRTPCNNKTDNYPSQMFLELRSTTIPSHPIPSVDSRGRIPQSNSMANTQKTYFLPPSWDYHPSGPIQLGNLILSHSTPADALNGPACPRPPPDSLFPPVPKTNETWSTTTSTTHRYGIFTELLAPLLGLGVDAAVDHAARDASTFRFAESETREFAPTPDFVRACLAASPAALAVLQRTRFRRHLYMVTAVKVVRGARVGRGTVREGGVEFGLSLDGTVLGGAPVNLGPEVGVARGREERGAFDAAGELVFAFRLRKIVVRRGTGEVVRTEPFTSGAMYHDERRVGVEFVVDEAACEEASAEGAEAWEIVIEDGEQVGCVKPTSSGH